MDKTDAVILEILRRDGRASYSSVGEKVGLSRTAVKNQIVSLEQAGIIQVYRAVIPAQKSEMMPFIIQLETHTKPRRQKPAGNQNEDAYLWL